MTFEDKQKELREKIIANLDKKVQEKKQKKIQEKNKLKLLAEEKSKKEIKRLKKKFPKEQLAYFLIGDVIQERPLLESVAKARHRLYQKYNDRYPTLDGAISKRRWEWYIARKKAGLIKDKPKFTYLYGKEYLNWLESIKGGKNIFDESKKRDGFANWYENTELLKKDIITTKDGIFNNKKAKL